MLFAVARSVFCVPHHSCDAERVFSQASLIATNRRNRLSGEHVEQLVVLNRNLANPEFRKATIDLLKATKEWSAAARVAAKRLIAPMAATASAGVGDKRLRDGAVSSASAGAAHADDEAPPIDADAYWRSLEGGLR